MTKTITVSLDLIETLRQEALKALADGRDPKIDPLTLLAILGVARMGPADLEGGASVGFPITLEKP